MNDERSDIAKRLLAARNAFMEGSTPHIACTEAAAYITELEREREQREYVWKEPTDMLLDAMAKAKRTDSLQAALEEIANGCTGRVDRQHLACVTAAEALRRAREPTP